MAQPTKANIQAEFNDPGLFCTSALALVVDNFGVEALQWEPEAIEMEIEDRFDIKVNRLLADKINAGISFLASDLYHKSVETFLTINAVFNFRYAQDTIMNNCDADAIMWGVTEARMLEGPEDFDKAGFSHPIAIYVGKVLALEGISKPPRLLKFAEYDPNEIDNRDMALGGDLMVAESYWRRQESENDSLNDFAKGLMDTLQLQVKNLPLKDAVWNGKKSGGPAFQAKHSKAPQDTTPQPVRDAGQQASTPSHRAWA